MEINKQLFEDVLSGKLKGVFVLENTRRVSSNELRLSNNINPNYPYCLINDSYTNCGRYNIKHPGTLDIVDFIPETNMKVNMRENELTIEIPEGKIVDWEESKKQNKIVLKDKQLTYEDVCKKLFSPRFFYTDEDGTINKSISSDSEEIACPNNASTEHQLECILAKNQLANVCKFLNGDTDYSTIESCWGLDFVNKKIRITYYRPQESTYYQPQFVCKSKELAQQAIEILGEETVKLALEPLGI